MMNSFESIKYLHLGIALTVPAATMAGYERNQIVGDFAPVYIEAPYSQETTQLDLNLYNLVMQPNRSFRQLYSDISQSSWFSSGYKGRSLGDFIEVES